MDRDHSTAQGFIGAGLGKHAFEVPGGRTLGKMEQLLKLLPVFGVRCHSVL
jgi:hypothetical protein